MGIATLLPTQGLIIIQHPAPMKAKIRRAHHIFPWAPVMNSSFIWSSWGLSLTCAMKTAINSQFDIGPLICTTLPHNLRPDTPTQNVTVSWPPSLNPLPTLSTHCNLLIN